MLLWIYIIRVHHFIDLKIKIDGANFSAKFAPVRPVSVLVIVLLVFKLAPDCSAVLMLLVLLPVLKIPSWI